MQSTVHQNTEATKRQYNNVESNKALTGATKLQVSCMSVLVEQTNFEEPTMTGVEVLYEDAALARALQLASDLDFLEREERAYRRSHSRRRARQESSSRKISVRRVPDPPATGEAAEELARPEADDVATVPPGNTDPAATIAPPAIRKTRSCPHRHRSRSQRRRSSPRRRRTQPAPVTNPALKAMLDDGSTDEAKNKSLIYVPCEINHRIVEMMVDTGAQTSVISRPLMEKLCIDKKLNREKQGVAAGVGTARILGRVENCPVQIGQACFNLYFAVLDIDTDMMILGIDQMRRFNCLVDLQNNQLIFGGVGGVGVDFFTQKY